MTSSTGRHRAAERSRGRHAQTTGAGADATAARGTPKHIKRVAAVTLVAVAALVAVVLHHSVGRGSPASSTATTLAPDDDSAAGSAGERVQTTSVDAGDPNVSGRGSDQDVTTQPGPPARDPRPGGVPPLPEISAFTGPEFVVCGPGEQRLIVLDWSVNSATVKLAIEVDGAVGTQIDEVATDGSVEVLFDCDGDHEYRLYAWNAADVVAATTIQVTLCKFCLAPDPNLDAADTPTPQGPHPATPGDRPGSRASILDIAAD